MKISGRSISVTIAAFLLCAALAGLPAPVQAQSCKVFDGLGGSWSGIGRLKRSAKSKAEKIRCRLKFDWSANSSTLKHSLTCLGVDHRYGSSGYLKVAGTRVKGSFGGTLGSVSASGSCGSSSLNLAVVGKNKETGKTVRSRLTLSLAGKGKLSQSVSSTDAKTGQGFTVLTVSYSK